MRSKIKCRYLIPALANRRNAGIFPPNYRHFGNIGIWSIEVTYLELKTHWGLSDYMLRSVTGIERLLNLQLIAYGVLCVLPWIESAFKSLRELSTQERRYEVGKAINQDLFLRSFAAVLENEGNSGELATTFYKIARKIWLFARTGS